VKEGKVRKEKPLASKEDDDKPFGLPDGWVWCKLGEVIGLISGQHIETNLTNTQMKGLPYLTSPADFGFVSPTITKWTESPKVVACEKDILITVKGSGVGKTNILDVAQAVISRQLMAIRPQMSTIYNFTYLFIQSIRLSLQDAKDGLIPGISRDHLLLEFFPLPPLAEQQAIAASVDSLMAIIDKLEKQVAERKDQAQLLMQTVLREAFDGGATCP
jgi:type I restriction enzyme, S subunit